MNAQIFLISLVVIEPRNELLELILNLLNCKLKCSDPLFFFNYVLDGSVHKFCKPQRAERGQ